MELLPIVQKKLDEFKALAKAQGYDFLVTCTYRSPEQQNVLYAQGRTTPGARVTNARGGQSIHQYHCAFDIVPLFQGKAVWDNDDLWKKLGYIGQSVGLEWGGSWSSIIDRPHFQYTLGHTWEEFLAGSVDLTQFNIPNNMANEEETTNGSFENAVEYELVRKDTGEVVPFVSRGFNADDSLFVILQDNTEITFSPITFENDTYIYRTVGSHLPPNVSTNEY